MVFSLLLLIVAAIGGGLYVAYLDHTVRGQFEGKRWALPAYVYARPLELFPGARLSAAQLEQGLRLLDYRPADGPLRAGADARCGGGAAARGALQERRNPRGLLQRDLSRSGPPPRHPRFRSRESVLFRRGAEGLAASSGRAAHRSREGTVILRPAASAAARAGAAQYRH